MGVIQQAINKGITSVSLIKSLRQEPVSIPKMKQSIQTVEEQKIAKAKQKSQLESYKAKYQEAKLRRKQAMAKQRELKFSSGASKLKIAGEQISDPNLIKLLKETSNG